MLEDPYLWLENVDGAEAMAWVESQNALTKKRYEETQLFQDIYDQSLATLNSNDKLIYPSLLGEYVYNFWRDEENERGLLRRTDLPGYLSGAPEWETVLSIDELAKTEDENWVYKGHQVLSPDYRKTLLSLSRGGSDASVVREFDLAGKSFVENGFTLLEAKSDVAWRDENALYVGTDFGPGSMTESGYPRVIKLWLRDTPLVDATTLFEVEPRDLATGVWAVRREDESYDFITRAIDFWNDEKFLISPEGLKRLPLPNDTPLEGIFKGQVLVSLRSDWTREEGTYEKGSILSLDLAHFLEDPKAPARVLFDPEKGKAGNVESVIAIRDRILMTVTKDVKTSLLALKLEDGTWVSDQVFEQQETGGTTAPAAVSRSRDDFFLTHEDFLTPTALYYSDHERAITPTQTLPRRFDAEGLETVQFWAESKDKTLVPYYVIKSKTLDLDGKAPTLLYGYGGFEVSLLPSYLSLAGPAWLARGGVYVSANIRGGGEFGPGWHQAALRENRHKAFEDFEAVAEDLIRRGITSPRHLGIHGRSNGGLLTGAMLTRRPELFRAVLIGVPLLDMARYNKLLAGASWMAEYGDPDLAEDWAFIQTYSPYHNLDPSKTYPVPLIFTSTKDDRVHPGHARKMAARLQEMGHEVIYYENIEGGHAGASNNPQTAYFTALNYAYLWDRLT